MNRYQLELAEMDRRYQVKVRIASLTLVAVLVVAVAWGTGFSPSAAWNGFLTWIVSSEKTAQTVREDRRHVPPPIVSQDDNFVSSQPVDLLSATAASVSGTPQRLYLVETLPGRNPREGAAKIGTDPRAPQTYVAGATLLNGGRLAEIHRKYVVLERDGEQLRLALGSGSRNTDETLASDLAFVGGLPEATRPELAVDWLSVILRMSPVYENDLLIGMQVYPGTRSGTFHQLGLRSGDIVVAIDGSPVFDPATATQLFEPLIYGASVTLSVSRDSQVQMVAVDGSIVSRNLAEAEQHASRQSAALPSG